MLKKIYISAVVAVVLLALGFGVNYYLSQKGKDEMTIKNGSKVSLNYKLTVDGVLVDSSDGKAPLVFEHGQGQIIPGLEAELEGMKKGDKKAVTIPPEAAYGPHIEDGVKTVERSTFQNADELQVGGVVSGQAGDQQFQAIITELTDKEVTLDLNHPLAGKTLAFEIEVVSVE